MPSKLLCGMKVIMIVFVCLEFFLHITVDLRDSSESQVYNPKMTSTEFAELAKLCQDQNTLGYNLLSMAKGLADQLSTHGEFIWCKRLLVNVVLTCKTSVIGTCGWIK